MLQEEEKISTFNHSGIFTVLIVFILLITITGISVAAYTWNYTSTHANTIGTGNISTSLLESNDIVSLNNFVPISDEKGIALSKDSAYDFAVTTSATGAPGNINYKISIKKEPPSDGYVMLSDSNVKVYLTKFDTNGEIEVMSPILVSHIITSGDEGTLKFNSDKKSYLVHSHTTNKDTKTTKYRLRIWVDKKSSSSLNPNARYEYKLKIGVTGNLAL